MSDGYTGAFERAATVDYLFACAATTRAVADHHFDAVYAAYLADPAVRSFLEANNPAALAEMAERLSEAQERGLWRPRRSEEHTSELQSLMRISYAVFCLKKKNTDTTELPKSSQLDHYRHNHNYHYD